MRSSLHCFILSAVTLLAAPLRAQEPTHRWMRLGEEPGSSPTTVRVVYLEDTANVERAGPKRQIWMNMQITEHDSAGVATTTDLVSVVMFDCSTYKVKLTSHPWQDMT
jgi:hypothetical protein